MEIGNPFATARQDASAHREPLYDGLPDELIEAGFYWQQDSYWKIGSLLDHIHSCLAAAKSCVVFEDKLARIWPRNEKQDAARAAAIERFAKVNGLSVVIHDPGIQVTFTKL